MKNVKRKCKKKLNRPSNLIETITKENLLVINRIQLSENLNYGNKFKVRDIPSQCKSERKLNLQKSGNNSCGK